MKPLVKSAAKVSQGSKRVQYLIGTLQQKDCINSMLGSFELRRHSIDDAMSSQLLYPLSSSHCPRMWHYYREVSKGMTGKSILLSLWAFSWISKTTQLPPFYHPADLSPHSVPRSSFWKEKPWGKVFPNTIPLTGALRNITLNLERTLTPTCSDVKAMSLGTAAIPFSLTSGNILKRAISIAYMLDIAPPKGQSKKLPLLVTVNVIISHASNIPYFHWPRVLLGHRRIPSYWLSFELNPQTQRH